MKTRMSATIVLALASCLGMQAQAQSVSAGTLQLISDQFSFTEGPAADAQGNVYFTDQPNNTIWKYDVQGTLSLFMEHAGRSNGRYVDGEGRLIACDTAENLKKLAGADRFEEAFVRIVRGEAGK